MCRFNQKNQHVCQFTKSSSSYFIITIISRRVYGKKSKEVAGYQKAIDFLKGCELEIR